MTQRFVICTRAGFADGSN